MDPPHLPDRESDVGDEIPDVDVTPTRPLSDDERDGVVGQRAEQRLTSFYDDLILNPDYAKRSARFKAIITAYARNEKIQDICDSFGVTRTVVALTVKMAGISRGMDQESMAPEDVANLYSLLYAAQLEIEDLRRQLKG